MTARVLRALAADPAFWYLIVALAVIVAALVILYWPSPAMVPCAHWTAAHPWCQGPAGVTP